MENAEGRELLDNVTISDVGGSQYMIQRMAVDGPQLLSAELLQHHNGLVVDLGAGDFIPVNYTSEDLLSQDLTEEDRNLAAALVAVQLSQQQKQQQLQQDTNVIIHSPLPQLVSNASLEDNKVNLDEQQLILTDKGASINGSYLQIVETDNLYKQALPKLTLDSREFSNAHSVHVYGRSQDLQLIKSEEDLDNSVGARDSDGENKSDNRSSKKSLPHKKRISRKLKKGISMTRKVHKCNLCEQIFNTTEDFNAHQTLCQTTITPIHQVAFSCQLCNSTFNDQLRFFEHLKAHYEPNLAIQQNNNAEDTKTVIESNKTDTLLTSLLNLTCMQCNKTFRRQRAYEAHIREFHHKDELNEFSEPEDLMAGIEVQNTVDDSKAWYHRDDELHATEEDLRELEAQEHVCHICRQPFPLRAILHQHLVTCKTENANIVKETLLNADVKKKPKKKVTEFHCTECERIFTHKNSLMYHLRSHSGHRPHTCEQCGKSFFAASALKVHSRLHSGDKPYRCEFCGRYFRQWGDLKYHCISIHSDQKQYQCEYCGKNFARKYSLIVHRRIHTGEKNYRCEFCGKTFRASSYLQNHRRIHTGEKPHPCDVCGKRFRVRSDMKRHLRTHGRKRVGRGMSVQNDMVVTKVEQNDNIESILPDGEDSTETKYKDNDNSSTVQSLQYDQDPLDTVREGNTLYVMPILIT